MIQHMRSLKSYLSDFGDQGDAWKLLKIQIFDTVDLKINFFFGYLSCESY